MAGAHPCLALFGPVAGVAVWAKFSAAFRSGFDSQAERERYQGYENESLHGTHPMT